MLLSVWEPEKYTHTRQDYEPNEFVFKLSRDDWTIGPGDKNSKRRKGGVLETREGEKKREMTIFTLKKVFY